MNAATSTTRVVLVLGCCTVAICYRDGHSSISTSGTGVPGQHRTLIPGMYIPGTRILRREAGRCVTVSLTFTRRKALTLSNLQLLDPEKPAVRRTRRSQKNPGRTHSQSQSLLGLHGHPY
eukprot:3093242-Rhodomonas_salina.1